MQDDEPIYVSEVITRTMNPNFRTFNLEDCGPGITREDRIILRVWAKNMLQEEYALVMEEALRLRELVFICKDLSTYRHPFPINTPILKLHDGYYAPLSEPPAEIAAIPLALPKQMGRAKPLPSSSLDALLQLQNLDACIQDALLTRQTLETQISKVLAAQSESHTLLARASAAKERTKDVEQSLEIVQKRRTAARARREIQLKDLDRRREAIRKAYSYQRQTETYLEGAREKLDRSRETLSQSGRQVNVQRRRIAAELGNVFPIEPLGPEFSLLFAIRGSPLPNSDFSSGLPSSPASSKDQRLLLDSFNSAAANAAALGHVAQLLSLLAHMLCLPLPYPVVPRGSNSSVQDPISILPDGKRVFPLYQRGAARYRFEYGVFLLNKDVEFLVGMCGGRVVDIRDSLGNLKLLLEICGQDVDLRQRQFAGGRKMLMSGGLEDPRLKGLRGLASPERSTSSRRSDEDGGAGGSETFDSRIEDLNDELNQKIRELALEGATAGHEKLMEDDVAAEVNGHVGEITGRRRPIGRESASVTMSTSTGERKDNYRPASIAQPKAIIRA